MIEQGMELEIERPSWRQTLIYSVEKDISAEYEADKLILHSQNVRNLLSEFKNSDLGYIYAAYGNHQDIEQFINQTYDDTEPLKFYDTLKNDSKGKIILVHNTQNFIFCLIIPMTFFLSKPIDEKSIQLTLFRILSDISQTIMVCMNDQVATNWYNGENIPFSDQHFKKLSQFRLEQVVDQEIETQEISINNLVSKNFDEWAILPNTNHSQVFLMYNLIKFQEADKRKLKEGLRKTIIDILFSLFVINDGEVQKNMSKHLLQEFQTQKVVQKLMSFTTKWQNKINKQDKELYQKILNVLKEKKIILEKDVMSQLCLNLQNRIKSELHIENSYFYTNVLHFPQKIQFAKNTFIDVTSINYDYSEIKYWCRVQLNNLIDSIEKDELQTLVNVFCEQDFNGQQIFCQKCKFTTIRQTNQENQIEKLSVTPTQQFNVDCSKLLPKKNFLEVFWDDVAGNEKVDQNIKIVGFFNTNQESTDILIINSENKFLLFSVGSNGQSKLIRSFESLQKPVFLYQKNQNILFWFNLRKTDAVKLQISDMWKISDEIIYQDCQPLIMMKVVYINYDQTFIGIDDLGVVYKWTENQEKFQKIKCLSFKYGKPDPQILAFKPSKYSYTNYKMLEACPSGKQFFLSNSIVVDIYNVNHQLIKSIDFEGEMILFTDFLDAFLVKQTINQKFRFQKALVLKKLTNGQQIKQINIEEEQDQKIGNPFFDMMRGSQVKYGPAQPFQHQNYFVSQIHIINSQTKKSQISDYLNLIQIHETCKFDFPESKQVLEIIQRKNYEVNEIFRFLYTRVPLQFCTIENNQLTPLIDGFRQAINCHLSLTVPQRAKLLKLGYIEDYLMQLKEKIFVVSIIGRQSSGKSYLLNRIFGTRFTVAASRCTDGIWASITQINNQQFLILDCEGLFSSQRTKNEEIQLLSFLAAVCDVTILNQDLSFNRHLDKLLDNLTNALGRLTGDSLFKGTLMIVLRDISSKDSAGAKDQLLQNIDVKVRSRNSTFLNTLFNDTFNVFQFSNFEHHNFQKEIDDLRKKFIQFAENANRWKSGKELIQTIKILLVQLETQDDENTDDLHFSFQLDEAVEKAKRNWVTFESILPLEFKEKQLQNNSYVLCLESEQQSDGQSNGEKLVKQITFDLELNSQISQHQQNLTIIQQFLNELVKQRKSQLFAQFEKEIKSMKVTEKQNEIIKNQRTNIVRFFEEQERQYQICSMQCSKCYLSCSKLKNHSVQYQALINTKDNQMQNLQKKYERQQKTLEQNETITQLIFKEDQLLNEQLNRSVQDIVFFQKYHEFIKFNLQLEEIQGSINNSPLVDDNRCNEMNFMKIVKKLKYLFNYFVSVNERILYPDTDCITVSDLFQFIQKENQFVKEQKKLLSSQIFDLSQQAKKIHDKQSNLINQRQKAEVDLQEFKNKISGFGDQLLVLHLEIMLEKDQTEKLNQEHKNLEKTLLSNKIIERSFLYSEQLLDIQKTVEIDIIETESQISKLQADTLEVKKESQDALQKFQEETTQKLSQINSLTEDNYRKLIDDSKTYEQIDENLKSLQDDEKVIKSRMNQRKKTISQFEVEHFLKQLKVIDIKQFQQQSQSYEDVMRKIQKEQQYLQTKQQELVNQNILEIKLILSENVLGEKDLEKFKAFYKAAKQQEVQQNELEESKEVTDQLCKLKDQLDKLNFSLEDYKKRKYYFTLTLQLKQQQSKIIDLEKRNQEINNQESLVKHKISELIFQIGLDDVNIQLHERELSEKKTRINSAVEQQISVDENIKTIQNTLTEMVSFKELLGKYQNLTNSKNSLEKILQEWEKFNSIKKALQTEQDVIDQIQVKIEEKIELTKQHSEKQQQLEILTYENKELLQIQELQKELDLLKSQEKQEHSCLRESHICDEECIVCKDTRCNKKAGHQQEHLCDKLQHYCNQICSIASCESFCKKQFMHDGQHYCGNVHFCKVPCQYCGGDCQREQYEDHEEHLCQLKGCIQKCVLCDRACNQNHQHSRQEGDVHFCENIHSCKSQCNLPGVCVWEYQEEKRVWKSEISSFDYTYFKLIDGGKQLCSLQSEIGKVSHGEIHQCKTEVHKCGQKCPECDGLCTKNYGHEGFHFAKQHRNKDCQVFTLRVGLGEKVEFGENLETHKYQVGESSCPETCADSCARRSRAHFHLIQCEGGDKCLGKSNKFARHQKDFYQGFEYLQFDEVQCIEFWKLQKWEHPLCDGDKLATIKGCNFFCPFCSETKKQFCKQPAWHSSSVKFEDHDFWCKPEHEAIKSSFKGLDIAFVIDSTGSMASYIDQAKEMVQKIMTKAKLSNGTKIRFGIVAYRDHPPQDTNFITQVQQLGNEDQAIAFLNSMIADGGGDYPEAVLDGIQAAVNLSWKSEYEKMIFLIGDAPPHGRAYSDEGQWPEGCPCGINEYDLFKKMQRLSIKFKILELNSGLNKMIAVFKSFIPLEVLKEDSNIDFVTQVVNKVCQQIEMREITYRKT